MRWPVGLIFCVVLVSGCEPAPKTDDFGTVLQSPPDVPGADKPRPIPGLDPPAKQPPVEADSSSNPAPPVAASDEPDQNGS